MKRSGLIFLFPIMGTLFLGCRQEMYDQAKYEALEGSAFFEDGRSARPILEGTVPRGHLNDDEHFYKGTINGQPARSFPFKVTEDVLARGQERYGIYCAVCHDPAGYGEGIVVKRGFPPPPTLHSDRLRDAAPGYYFDVITNGFGTMYSYSSRIKPEDRWAIIAYVRALQRSQNARRRDVPPDKLSLLD